MNVTFVLPGASPVPAGGPRMVFRYANALAAAGWGVTVVMPASSQAGTLWKQPRQFRQYWTWILTRGYTPDSWIDLHSRVKLKWVPTLDPRQAPRADVVIATAVQTAEAVAKWPASAGRRFYFIQGYETWDFPRARVESSWRLPFVKIAVSHWLCDLVAAAGEHASHLPNGVDSEAFGLDVPVDQRREACLLWPHHRLAWKGSADVWSAVEVLGHEFPGLMLQAFGTVHPPSIRPERFAYFQNPSQAVLRQLYNKAMVVVAPSHSEGWGLPACEALQCGCALAASDVGGHREFLRHDSNALLHAPGDIVRLAENIRRLLADERLRLRLAKQGLADMAALRFEPAVDRLKKLLQETGVA